MNLYGLLQNLPLHNAIAEVALNEAGEDGENIEAHGQKYNRLVSFKMFKMRSIRGSKRFLTELYRTYCEGKNLATDEEVDHF